jgi:hypothetical protein
MERSYHGDYSYFDFFVDTWLGLIFMIPLLIWAWYNGYQQDGIKGLLFHVYLTFISVYIYYIFDEIDERITE